MLEFEWDKNKAKLNFDKHRVSFEESKTVFRDFNADIFDDERHSTTEKRELIIGKSNNNRLLITCFTVRGHKIRIINSRLTNKRERYKYEENKRKY